MTTSNLQDAYDRGQLEWKAAYRLTGARGQDGQTFASDFLTHVSGHAPTVITGKDDNRLYGDLRMTSGATVEVKTQPLTVWAPPTALETGWMGAPTQPVTAHRPWNARVYPTNYVELGVALLNPADHKPYHADWAERTAAAFNITVDQVLAARVRNAKTREWSRLDDYEQVAVAFTSWLHAALVLYVEPRNGSVCVYTGQQLLRLVGRAFTRDDVTFVRDAGRSSPGTVGLLNVPYGPLRFQRDQEGQWHSVSWWLDADTAFTRVRDSLASSSQLAA